MDTFMDKLAQKLNAQEMIKANAAADAAELSRLREQTAEYEALFQKIKEGNEQNAAKVEAAAAKIEENANRVEQSAAKFEENAAKAEQSAAKFEENAAKAEQIAGRVEQGAAKVEENAAQVAQCATKVEELLAAGAAKIEEMQAAGLDTEALETLIGELKKLQAEQNVQLTEHVHKESVKVYRNVQAVINDEVEKFNGSTGKNVMSLSGRLGAVLGISIVALLVSVAGLVFQILVYLHII